MNCGKADDANVGSACTVFDAKNGDGGWRREVGLASEQVQSREKRPLRLENVSLFGVPRSSVHSSIGSPRAHFSFGRRTSLFGAASNTRLGWQHKQAFSQLKATSSSTIPQTNTPIMASLGEDLLGVVNKLQDLVFNTIGNDSLDLPQIVCTLLQTSVTPANRNRLL